jgi:small subunit ribosomal protein S15
MFEIYEDSPTLTVPYDLIAELEEQETLAAANKVPSAALQNAANIKAAVEKWRLHENDCGSAEVQVAIANEKIKYLTKHLLANKKDVAAKRGLNALVTKRRKFLNYLFETNNAKALEIIKDMKIRFRPPGRQWDKEAKYAAFKNTKTQFKVKKEKVSSK